MDKNFKIIPLSTYDRAQQLQKQAVDALSPVHQGKIKELKQLINVDLTKHPHRNHEDYYLYRWLKINNFDVKVSEKMLKSHLSWRKQWKVDEMAHDYEPSELLRTYYPMTQLGHDSEGVPIWMLLHGRFDLKGLLHACTPRDFLEYLVYIMEYGEYEYVLQAEKFGAIVDKHNVIVDLDQFDFKSALWKPALETSIKLVTMFESNYPCKIKRGIMINAPKIFTMFYTMVKPFLSEYSRNSIQIYGRDGWQVELRNLVKADNLPKHWGGNAVDEIDGNPYCSSKVCMGGKVPQSKYSAQLFLEEQKFISTIVPRKERFLLELQVVQSNSSITWSFKTDHKDIGFGISYKSDSRPSSNTETKYMKKVECVDPHRIPEVGAFLCREPGIYTLIFDNSYSWIYNKTLLYKVELISPEDS